MIIKKGKKIIYYKNILSLISYYYRHKVYYPIIRWLKRLFNRPYVTIIGAGKNRKKITLFVKKKKIISFELEGTIHGITIYTARSVLFSELTHGSTIKEQER